jgi:DNA-binding transcriptional MerR regulator
LSWLDLLIRLRNTGMPRAQMVRFAQLRRQGAATATERRLMLEEHQRALEQSMQELQQHMAVLQKKIARIKEIEANRDASLPLAPNCGQDEEPFGAGLGEFAAQKM